jgi:hypothetical protein
MIYTSAADSWRGWCQTSRLPPAAVPTGRTIATAATAEDCSRWYSRRADRSHRLRGRVSRVARVDNDARADAVGGGTKVRRGPESGASVRWRYFPRTPFAAFIGNNALAAFVGEGAFSRPDAPAKT